MKRSIFGLMCALVMLTPPAVLAQEAADAPTPQTSTGGEKPPAAVGEEGKKPTRGFVSSLGHNLVDDVKHMPRWNSLYWLAGGGALALAVHPEDNEINQKIVDHTPGGVWTEIGRAHV